MWAGDPYHNTGIFETYQVSSVNFMHDVATFYRNSGIVSKMRLFEKEGKPGDVIKLAEKKNNLCVYLAATLFT